MGAKKEVHIQGEFSRRLKSLMTDRTPKVTHQKLADYVGVERQSVTSYVRGVCIPKADVLAGIARYFGVTADWLLGIDTTPPREMTEEEAMEVLHARSGLSDTACRKLMYAQTDTAFLSQLIEDDDTLNAVKTFMEVSRRKKVC